MIWQALFMLTLIPALALGMRRGGDLALVAIVIAGSWAISYFSFDAASPMFTNAASDVLAASFIAMFCTSAAAVRVGGIFFASSLISIAHGVYMHPQTSYGAWYAHALSVLGHAENLALIHGAADDGLRTRLRSLLRPMGRAGAGGFHRGRSASEADGA